MSGVYGRRLVNRRQESKSPATPTEKVALASTAPPAAPPSPNLTMAFGWRRRQPQPSEPDAAVEKAEVQRVRKRDLLRQLFSGAYADKKQERAASIPSVVEPEVPMPRPRLHCLVADMATLLQRKSLLEPLRELKKHYRSRSSFAKTADDDRSAVAASTSDVPATQPAQTDDADDARSEVLDDVSTPDPSGLTEDDIPNLFAGAPLFSVDKVKGRRIPRVDFPYDDTLIVRDVSDSLQLSHEAFSSATLRPHLCQVGHQDEKKGLPMGYDINVVETPSMLGAQGLEPGTVGFDHFLEIPRSDHLRIGDNDDEAIVNRELLEEAPEKLGIKWLDQRLIYERLMELSQVHQAFKESAGKTTILHSQAPGEMYAHLFGKFLMPPRYDGSTGDPTGLKVQIETLIRVLRLKGIWNDFSLVEWRIRFGRILWDTASSDPEDSEEYAGPSERDVLLLQILLASELLLRLDAISGLTVKEVTEQLHLTEAEVRNFATIKSRKTDWDLVLARRFLENIEISEETPAPLTPKRKGFLAALNVTRSTEEEDEPQETEFWLRPRYRDRQLSGLLHFAEAIAWPRFKEISINLTAKLQDSGTPPSPSAYATPLASPLATPRVLKDPSGYFDEEFRRPRPSRMSTSRSIQLHPSVTSTPATPQRPSLLRRDSSQPTSASSNGPTDIGGWLSRTYLTGLVLPGEAISHFLISTLLENDKTAVTTLGDSANLYGGFIYAERSWWSKTCIVGRVLATMEGSKECMGWISVPYVPLGFRDSWIDIVNGTAPPSPGKKTKSRIDCGEKMELDSSYLAGKLDSEVTGEDFTLPKDSIETPAKLVRFNSLQLLPEPVVEIQDPVLAADAEPQLSYAAQMAFDLLETSVTLSLTYDIQFITAWPCTPPSSATNKKLRRLNRNSTGGRCGPVSAHPLHVAHKYRVISPVQLLAGSPHLTPASSTISLLDETAASGEVLVIDARPPRNSADSGPGLKPPTDSTATPAGPSGGADAALLARAWCADRGEHALVGRVGRTCLACCVREARALGVRIVIRV
ncbi:tpr domain containing protein [Diplodia corticola]|uniref:Tpr domain containing protein n=1 Tax=Diplodia corticola TaxID=236234 RepID=A0A1J9S7Q1_9PEZI|nr:tpr domain containing protein [Diplodia corticola]OJD35621.1 tpr domain containing protein [Diplodia corticola]